MAILTVVKSGCLVASALAPLIISMSMCCSALTVLVLWNSMFEFVVCFAVITTDTGAVSLSVYGYVTTNIDIVPSMLQAYDGVGLNRF